MAHLIFISNIQKRSSTKNHQKKIFLSYIDWYKLNHFHFSSKLSSSSRASHADSRRCLKDKGHTKYIALNTLHVG